MSGQGSRSKLAYDSADRVRRLELVAQAKSRWRKDKSPEAADFLARHATIRRDRSLALDLAYEEYCIRVDNGEQLDAVEFCHQFPSLRRSLKRQIEVDQVIRDSARWHASPIEWPQPGDPLMGFRVVGLIAQGGFARVYLCAQADLGDRQVVVKVAQHGAPEANTLGRLNHPNIIAIHSVEVDAATDLSCICMPFCGRSTLFDLIDIAFGPGPLPQHAGVILEAARSNVRRTDRYHTVVPRMRISRRASYVSGILTLAVQIAEALQHAHGNGVRHGDLKPSNVVLSNEGTPLVLDFNLSLGPDSNPLMTGGTLPYMPPEVTRTLMVGPDEQDCPDARSDVFSLGAVLYELLCGSLPFLPGRDADCATTATHLLNAQAAGARPLTELNPAVDPQLSDFVQRCLSFDPIQRPQTMKDVCIQLRRHLSRARRAVRFIRDRRRFALALTAGVASASVAAALYVASLPSARDRYYARGVRQFERGEYHQAIESFSNSIQLDRQFYDAHFARGCAALHQYLRDQRQEALDMADRDFSSAGDLHGDPRALVGESMVRLKKNEFDTAVNAMENAINQGIESKEVWNNLGYAYSKLVRMSFLTPGNHKEFVQKADSAFRRAIAIDDEISQAHLNLAILELYRYRTFVGYIPREGLKSIRRITGPGANDVTTFFFASKIAGVVAEADNDSDLWTECIRYLDRAQQLGFNLNAFESSHPFTNLASDPRFEELLKRKNRTQHQPDPDRIAVPDILTPSRR